MAQDKTFGDVNVEGDADVEGNVDINGNANNSETRSSLNARTISLFGTFPSGNDAVTETIDVSEYSISAGSLDSNDYVARGGNAIQVTLTGYNGFNGNNALPAYSVTILRSELDGDNDTIDEVTSLSGSGGTGGFDVSISSVSWSGTGNSRTLDAVTLQLSDSNSDIVDSSWCMKIEETGFNIPGVL